MTTPLPQNHPAFDRIQSPAQLDPQDGLSVDDLKNQPAGEVVHVPPPIKGYRNLTQGDVDLMNRIKAKGDEIGALIKELRQRGSAKYPPSMDLDQRWVSIGETHLQQGIMALCRAVAQPSNF